MNDIRTYSVYPSNLNILSAFRKFDEFLKERDWKEEYIYQGELNISPFRKLEAKNFIEFIKLLENYPNSMPITLSAYWKKKNKLRFENTIGLKNKYINISVTSDDLDVISSVHDNLQEFFQASNPQQNQFDRLSRYGLKKSIFLAHKFDDYGKTQSEILKTYLERLGFDVKEGIGYEAKNIPEKVANKIDSQDIFICLVTSKEYNWILSEAAYAKGKNKYIIIICQKGIKFNKGIIGGDYEHLLFPNNFLEKCFSDLIYALPI